MTDHETPLLNSYSPEQQERLSAEYAFVFCYHTPEFAKQIAEAVQDCDTVAFEYLGFKSEDERQAWNDKLTTYVAGTATVAQKDEVRVDLSQSADGGYLGAVLQEFQGSNKKIVLLDIDEDNPDYRLVTNYWNTNRGYYRAISDGSTVQEVRRAATTFLQSAVDSFPVRESAMAEQLKSLGRVPGKIGVITGVIHTPLLEELSDVAETSSEVIGPEVKIVDGLRTVEYDDFDIAIQQARSGGMESVDPLLLDRGILEDLIVSYDVDLGDQNLLDLIDGLLPQELNGLLEKIDEVREANAKYTKGFMRLVLAKNDVIAVLRDVWPNIPENSKVVVRKVQ